MSLVNQIQTNPDSGGQMIITRLSEVLNDRGRSLYWLQQQTGIAYTTLWRLNTGKANSVTFPILDLVCKTLECQPGDLLVMVEGKQEGRRKSKSKPKNKSG